MTWDSQTIIGLLAALVGIIGYVPYYRGILRGKTKPHPFSWIIFALLTSVVFFGQLTGGAGPGAWVSGVSALGIIGIALLALRKGEKQITPFDWLCFLGAFFGIFFWHATRSPLTAIIIVTLVNAIAFAPTLRTGYGRPHQEVVSFWFLGSLKYFISLFALSTFNITTTIFPLYVVISNVCFVALLLVRRQQIDRYARVS